MTKKLLISAMFLFLISPLANAQSKFRYIVFFAQTSNIPQPVINKILASNYFCLSVPIGVSDALPNNIEELIASGKAEAALSFEHEPLLPIASSVYGPVGYTPDKQDIFVDYFKSGIEAFKNKMNQDRFGLYLKSGDISSDFLTFFAQNKFVWANTSNIAENIYGTYRISGMNTFSVYKNFPSNSNDVMKWLGARNEFVIPVLLTERQLNDTAFMSYIIDLFDKSLYIKPIAPLYLSNVEKESFAVKTNVSFSQLELSGSAMEKLNSAADMIKKYRNMPGYSQVAYKNAQSEFLALLDYQLLLGVESRNPEYTRLFSAIHENVLKFMGISIMTDADKEKMQKNIAVYENTGEESLISADIWSISGGISVASDDLIKGITIVSSAQEGVKITLKFGAADWNNTIAFIDLYIDINNVDGLGSTAMLKGVKGFLDSNNGWEFAVRIYKNRALLYRDTPNGPALLGEFLVKNNAVIINKFLKGNPRNWAVQAVAINTSGGDNKVIDFLGSGNTKTKKEILSATPIEIPAVKVKQ
ncbi:MAG: hypothetical protein LBV16_08525 [Elusimicrobiota bacterium]|jgi:hypothetical protein|nr:hypothetical protein [Elusimicrobiota bacterium]